MAVDMGVEEAKDPTVEEAIAPTTLLEEAKAPSTPTQLEEAMAPSTHPQLEEAMAPSPHTLLEEATAPSRAGAMAPGLPEICHS